MPPPPPPSRRRRRRRRQGGGGGGDRTRGCRFHHGPRVTVLLLLLLLGVVVDEAYGSLGNGRRNTATASQNEDGENSRFSRLSAWLAKFRFSIPSQRFVVPYAGVDVVLETMECTNLTVSELDAFSLSSASARGPGDVQATARDVRLDCALGWEVTDRIGNKARGDASATISRSTVRAALEVDVDESPSSPAQPALPRSVLLSECEAELVVDDLSFSGGKFASVLNAAAPAIRRELGRTLSSLTCSAATAALERFSGVAKGQRWEDGALARDERAIAGLFAPVAPIPFPEYNASSGVADLATSGLVEWLDFMSASYIGAQGPRSLSAFARWIEDQNEKNHQFNARVVRVPPVWLFDQKTSLPKLSVALDSDIMSAVSSTIESATFVVYDMKLIGLDSAKTLAGPTVVPMADNSTLKDTQLGFRIGWQRVLFNVSGVLDILPTNIALDPYLEPLIASFELRDPEFALNVGLAVDEEALSQLRGTRRANVACLSNVVRAVRLRSLTWDGSAGAIIVTPWRVNKPVDESEDSLEASLDALITKLSRVITEKLSDAVHLIVAHQLESSVRNALDATLQKRLHKLQSGDGCPRVPRASERFAVFKRALSVILLSAAVVAAQMFVLVFFGYFAFAIAIGKFGKWCYKAMKMRIIAVSKTKCDGTADANDDDDDDDEYDSDDLQETTPQPSSARRNYSRALFHSAIRRGDVAEDDTSMITESLLGDAEVNEDGDIVIDEEALQRDRASPLMNSQAVPRTSKYGVAILNGMAIMLFLSSNLSVGATLNVRAQKFDESDDANASLVDVFLPGVFTFSLGDTVGNMWNARVYALACFILLFSGLWPYVKLGMSWYSWSAPVGVAQRESILRRLDAFGKWSLVDCFVMMLFMILFHFEISAVDPGNSGNSGALTISVQPARGFFVFLFATVLSMCIGHATMVYHKLDVALEEEREEEPEDEERKAVWRRDATRDTVSWVTVVVTTMLLVANVATFVYAFFATSIEFTFLGVAGAALGEESSTRTISLHGVARQVRDASPELSRSMSRLLEWVLLLFTFAMPLVRRVTMLVLWLLPLRKKEHEAVWFGKDCIEAWSALDVMVLSFVAVIAQIRQFLGFMIGDNCQSINDVLQQLVSGPLYRGHDLCFDVDSRLGLGAWLLLVCVLADLVATRVVSMAYAKALR